MAAGPGIPPNCVGCDFAKRDFHGADFRGVNYVGVDLSRANLAGARFQGASLEGVDFSRANLHDADFRDAKLCWRQNPSSGGDPIGCADFEDANVQGANFRGALLCDGRDKNACSNLGAATLQRYSHSSLTGAILP